MKCFPLWIFQVADIKRANNFIQEQDFYALKSIKIPVKVNGLLTETEELLPLHTPALLSEHSVSIDPEIGSGNQEQLDQYFRGIDQNIETVTQVEIPSRTDHHIEPSNWSSQEQKATCTGADYGIQWWKAVFLMLLIGIGLPVFYIVYFKTQQLDMVPGASNTTDPIKISANSSSVGRSNYAGQENTPTVHTTKQALIPSGGWQPLACFPCPKWSGSNDRFWVFLQVLPQWNVSLLFAVTTEFWVKTKQGYNRATWLREDN